MAANILLIGGFPSSGTDLLRNVLNAHSQVHVGGEFPFLPSLADTCPPTVPSNEIRSVQTRIRDSDIYGNLKNSEGELSTVADLPFADIYALMLTQGQFSWYGNKTPQNTENIAKLDSLFPTAKFIVIVRDIRDVVLSWKRKWGKDMLLCAEKWDSRMRLGLQATEALSTDRYLYIAYEDLLDQLEFEVRKICKFLSIPYEDRLLQFHEYIETKVPGKINFGEPIVRTNSNKWVDTLDEHTLRRVEEIAWPTMLHFGYKPVVAEGSLAIRRWERIRGYLADFYALLFVGNRALTENKLRARITSILVIVKKALLRTT